MLLPISATTNHSLLAQVHRYARLAHDKRLLSTPCKSDKLKLMNARAIFMRGLPLWYFLLLFFFYGYQQVSFSMMNKIAGLLALLLLGTSFLIGPLSYFLPQLFTQLKIYRKYLGISGFVVAVIHATLSTVFYFKMDLAFMLFDGKNPHLLGVWLGILAVLIFFSMTLTSTEKAIETIGAANWKKLQTGGYLALTLVMAHFILMETNNGLFVIRRPLGRAIFVFGFVVLAVRLLVFFLALRKKPTKTNSTTAAS